MESWIGQLSEHGYSILFVVVFLEALGLPVPGSLAMLVAGAACAHGSMSTSYALAGALTVTMAGDTVMFVLGRYTGWWLLGLLCRLSFNPESCMLRSADSFYRRGKNLLVVAKFIPGINTMAPPLAGSMNMRFMPFFGFDLAGTVLYVGVCFGIGFLFSDALAQVTRGYHAFGRIVGWGIIALVVAYAGFQIWFWIRERSRLAVNLVTPAEAADGLSAGANIFDVRSHGYFDPAAIRIKGSSRLDPNALNQIADEALPRGRQIYLYCTCVREATSARVARQLQLRLKGKEKRDIAVIKGGLRAWKKAGLPVEEVPLADVAPLPMFQ